MPEVLPVDAGNNIIITEQLLLLRQTRVPHSRVQGILTISQLQQAAGLAICGLSPIYGLVIVHRFKTKSQ